MYNVIGELVAWGIIAFLISPLALIIYMIRKTKIDVDGDGKSDIKWSIRK